MLILCLLGLHAYLLAYGSIIHSPARDEVAHLPAGISHWTFGRFELYRVNPPLVRTWAAAPVVLAGPQQNWANYWAAPRDRQDFRVGSDFMHANGPNAFFLFTLARWACIPFSLLGACMCYLWARRLYGSAAGLAALLLWCTAPEVIANGQLITPDMAATAVGFGSYFLFVRWLTSPNTERSAVLGLALGVLQLTKATWLLFYPVLIVQWLVERLLAARRTGRPAGSLAREGAQLLLAFVTSLTVLNAGYLFQGSGKSLGEFDFISQALGGAAADGNGNRFRGTYLASVPVPLPVDYVYGLDYVKYEFESGYASYLRGEWKHGGWWYYYLYGLAVKTPMGMLALAGLAAMGLWCGRPACRQFSFTAAELRLLVPAAYILLLTSWQTGFNHHLRYVLPALPFLLVLSCRSLAKGQRNRTIRGLAWACVVWSAAESISVYPHSHSFFNHLAGGPENGHRHLLNSNIDWGQDVLLLRRWLDAHPEVDKLYYASFANYSPAIAGISGPEPYPCPEWPPLRQGYRPIGVTPAVGWYALSVNRLHAWDQRYGRFRQLKPVDRVGYSTYIYRLDEADLCRVYQRGMEEDENDAANGQTVTFGSYQGEGFDGGSESS